jgi:aspartate racemase
MKTIGLIGGTSWISTIDYYRIINSTVNERLGGVESARMIIHSVNYGEIVSLTFKDDWDSIERIISKAAQEVERAGVDCLLLCANTMHRIADQVQAAISIPLIHIVDVTAKAVSQKGIDKALLLGTRYTMSGDFYKQRLEQQGIKRMIPEGETFEFVNNTIYNEMGKGVFLPETKRAYIDIISSFIPKGAQAVILGCTEIPLLLKPEEIPLPVFDTLRIHATAAVDFALN